MTMEWRRSPLTSSSWIQLVLGGKCALHGSVEAETMAVGIVGYY